MRSASRACCRYLFFWRSSLRSGYSGRRAKLIGGNVATLKLRHCPRMGLVAQAASLLLSRTPIKPINVSQVVDALRRLVATPLQIERIDRHNLDRRATRLRGHEDHCRDTAIKREGSTSPVAVGCDPSRSSNRCHCSRPPRRSNDGQHRCGGSRSHRFPRRPGESCCWP